MSGIHSQTDEILQKISFLCTVVVVENYDSLGNFKVVLDLAMTCYWGIGGIVNRRFDLYQQISKLFNLFTKTLFILISIYYHYDCEIKILKISF